MMPSQHAMTSYKLKPLPGPFNRPALRPLTQSCAFILAVNWCLQGMRGMDRKELTFRVVLELLVATAFLLLLRAGGIGAAPAIATALLLAHGLSFTLNGQVWVCARYCRWYGR